MNTKAAQVRACWERRSAGQQIEQIREHGLAAAGQSKAPKDKVARASQLASDQTMSERRLGQALKRLPITFHAQRPLHGYIVDFYAPESRLAMEVDGAGHDGREMADRLRDDVLRAQGIEVLRFTNRQVREELDRIVVAVAQTARERHRRWSPVVERELDTSCSGTLGRRKSRLPSADALRWPSTGQCRLRQGRGSDASRSPSGGLRQARRARRYNGRGT